ncbi:relA-associated inhibitor [Pezoporus flaviventris]|uniref:relA-associated inhibitor n=1 Tax=Pezoporus flaviventris TaxID=889875 RepID=UPI002AB274E8|nr:relA-associated inhibitor [Pezoporus flaviventris]
MASERLQSAQDLLDLTFQSLAMQHMDLKQVELDTAVAKVDELSRQLESLWSDGPGPPPRDIPGRSRSPLARRSLETPEGAGDALGPPGSPRAPHFLQGEDRAPSPRPKLLAVPGGGRAPSPRPPLRPYELLGMGGGPRPLAPPPYEMHGLYPSIGGGAAAFRAQDDSVLKRRPQKGWNESDLDLVYEKKPPSGGGFDRPSPSLGLMLSPWRESSLDGAGGGKDAAYGGHSSTLPRNFKLPPGERRGPEGPFRRGGAGSLPRAWPVSRIPVPPPAAPRPPRQKPLPLSVIFKLQNAFWEQGGGAPRALPLGPPPSAARAPQKQPQGPALPPGEAVAAGGGLGAGAGGVGDGEAVARPLSPTRLQPLLPAEAQRDPEFRAVARSLAEMPRPLKRRGSMEQSPGPPPRARQYQELITKLLHRGPPPAVTGEPETGAGAAHGEGRQSPPAEPEPESPAPAPVQELRSALRDPASPRKRPGARVRLNPLVLLLDAALTGELEVVQQAVAELNDPSQPNDEGITALHNAICGAHYGIVEFLIASGANVNSPDSHGWTPLHCAASCNDTSVCVALVRHGAAIFATTTSDGSLAVEKCDPYREGYSDCYNYLTEVEQGMGVLNSGVVYALWDYSAALGDELSFREGEPVTVLRRQRPGDVDWWWGSLYGHEGFVPRNYFGLFPRLRPQRRKL